MKTTLMLISTLLITVASLQMALGDDDETEYGGLFKRTPDVAPVNNALYSDECGGCHMAYPPGLLPQRSWKKIMAGLEDHFGDNAELDVNIHTSISSYLETNSADQSHYRRSRKIMRSISPNGTPLRITDLPYIRHEHDEIPANMVKNNDLVGSLSNCTACHANAEKGMFNERDIVIPGYAGWDD